MPDLNDGESVEMKGSGARPYVLRNVGGVYSCTCPAWRNQSEPIERRTCKHLRKLRGEEAEKTRIGGALPVRTASTGDETATGPPLLLAHSWDNSTDLADWWMSEKLDGVRAYWDGSQFLSRPGNRYHAPAWFTEALPPVPLDGELWIARRLFQRTVSIVRRQDQSDHWKEVRFVVFDAPGCGGAFEQRWEFLAECLAGIATPHVSIHHHQQCRDLEHLRAELNRVEELGGEGLMLRQPGSEYEVGRSMTLLKVKSFRDAEAVVLAHQPGAGRHRGRLGALLVQMADGTQFAVGTGFSDAQRAAPPPVGSVISFRYQELSDGGVPRFPSFAGVRHDSGVPAVPTGAPQRAPARTPAPDGGSASPRYFEFTAGTSRKFWEIGVRETVVTVRYGRIGSEGQSREKAFADAGAAARHAEDLIAEKTGEGYLEP